LNQSVSLRLFIGWEESQEPLQSELELLQELLRRALELELLQELLAQWQQELLLLFWYKQTNCSMRPRSQQCLKVS
jgi:hypothetical protein